MSISKTKKSKYWQYEFSHEGKRYARSSKVKIEGDKDAPEGSAMNLKYWASRRKAEAIRDDHKARLTNNSHALKMAEDVYRLRHGTDVPEINLSDLYTNWLAKSKQSNGKQRSDRYLAEVKRVLEKFAVHCAGNVPKVTTMSAVNHTHAVSYLDDIWAQGVTGKTWNNYLQILRSTFDLLQHEGGCPQNPFAGIRGKHRETVHKEPFNLTESKLILQTAEDKGDDISHLIILGLCTALRRGDACRLEWKMLDKKFRILSIRTRKTGKEIQIPVFPPLRRILEKREQTSDFVFPDLARMIRSNPDGITWRVQQFLKALDLHNDGEIRERGQRKGNKRGYHTLRTSFITIAFEAGLPESVIRQVTGHTTDVIARYYYQPKPESIRKEFEDKLANLFE